MLFFICLMSGLLLFHGVNSGSPLMDNNTSKLCHQFDALTPVHQLYISKEPSKPHDNTIDVVRGTADLRIVFEVKVMQKTYIEIYVDGIQKLKGVMPEGMEERWEASWSIQVRIENAGGVKARINGRDHILGGPGQIVNKVIIWTKDQSTQDMYNLELKDW